MAEQRRPRRKSDKWLPRLLILSATVSLIALVVVIPLGYGVVRNSERIELQEKGDRDALRGAAFRLCSRDMQVRADLHAAATERGEPGLRSLREKRLPILDCSPNLDGQPAAHVGVALQRRYVALYVARRSPVICQGEVHAGGADRQGGVPSCDGADELR